MKQVVNPYFFEELSYGTDENIEPMSPGIDGTYEIDTRTFRLQFCVRGGIFYVENIVSHVKGYGRRIVEVIKQFAEDCELLVIAQQFLDEAAEAFWKAMGFIWSDYYEEYVYDPTL